MVDNLMVVTVWSVDLEPQKKEEGGDLQWSRVPERNWKAQQK